MDQMELSPPIQGVSDPSRTLAAIAATVARRIARAAHRRELSGLSDRQLRDAGIDLSMAGRGKAVAADAAMLHRRSEEHTSELQSLMRISYAVFCLKKKTKSTTTPLM